MEYSLSGHPIPSLACSTIRVEALPPSSPIVTGTCSCCGGRVCVPSVVWVGFTDATPTCLDCGARAAPPPLHGPVIQMSPRRGR